MTRLLLVEDDERIAAFVRRGLESEGFVLDLAASADEALQQLRTATYALVILDRMLPDGDGLEVCRMMRQDGIGTLILMLTARDTLSDKIDGLKGGADDYLTKPFAFDELLVRIETLLRRASLKPPRRLMVGDLTLDLTTKVAQRADRAITLTAKEFALLAHLMAHAGEVVSRTTLLSEVWSLDFDPGTKVVDVYIRYLRQKVDDGEPTALIQTVRGFGYMMKA